MALVCVCGDCLVRCPDGCWCACKVGVPSFCHCQCDIIILPKNKRAKGEKKNPYMRFKRAIKENPQTRFNFCAKNASIVPLSQSFDKILPDRILVPANKVNTKVNLSLKNKTFSQIVSAAGLTLKS